MHSHLKNDNLVVCLFPVWLASSGHSVYSWGAARKTGREKKKMKKARREGAMPRYSKRLSQCGVTLCTKLCERTNEAKQCFVYFAKRYFSKRFFAFFVFFPLYYH